MRSALGVVVVVLAAGLAGCASAPPPQQPAVSPGITAARAAIQQGSPVSLRAAAQTLAKEPAQDTHAADVAGLGRNLFARLYPELTDNPFPADAATPTYQSLFDALSGKAAEAANSDEPDFFRIIIPALVLLDSTVNLDPPQIQAFQAGLKTADEISGGTSVIPPYLLGVAAERSGADAIPLLQESLRRDASFYPAQKRIAELLIKQKKTAEAVTELQQLSQSLPGGSLSMTKELASSALESGQTDVALDVSGKALTASPNDADLMMIRARAFAANGDWYQATRVLDMLQVAHPDVVDAYLLKAELLAGKAGNPEEAVQVLSDAEAKFPKDAGVAELKGRILLDSGRTDDGMASLNHALELQPGRQSTLRILAAQSVRSGQWMQANTYITQILASSSAADDLSMAYTISWNLGDFDQAAGFAQKLLSQKAPGGRLLLAQALHAAGKDSDARAQANTGLSESTTAQDRSRFQTVIAETERSSAPDDALRDVRTALMQDADNTDALLLISDLLIARNDYHGASVYLKRASDLMPGDAGLRLKLEDARKKDQGSATGATP